MVKFYDPVEKQDLEYYIDLKIDKYLERKVKKNLQQEDRDYVLAIDGYEGSGKSTFAKQLGKRVDPTLDIDRVCFSPEEFQQAILNAKKGQCVIYDEAATGLLAANSIGKVGKLLKSLMMQMRQKNLFVIIVLPVIFELNKYAILSRARAMFHVYEKNGIRGYFAGFNRRDMRKLYFLGKKTYSYRVRSQFIGRFYGKNVINDVLYRKKKELSLQEEMKADEESLGKRENKALIQRNLLLGILKEQLGTTNTGLSKFLTDKGLKLSHDLINISLNPVVSKKTR